MATVLDFDESILTQAMAEVCNELARVALLQLATGKRKPVPQWNMYNYSDVDDDTPRVTCTFAEDYNVPYEKKRKRVLLQAMQADMVVHAPATIDSTSSPVLPVSCDATGLEYVLLPSTHTGSTVPAKVPVFSEQMGSMPGRYGLMTRIHFRVLVRPVTSDRPGHWPGGLADFLLKYDSEISQSLTPPSAREEFVRANAELLGLSSKQVEEICQNTSGQMPES